MRKTNSYIKTANLFKKIALLLFFEFVIVILFSVIRISGKTINESQLMVDTITVDDVEFTYEFIHGKVLIIYSNNRKYEFEKHPVRYTGECSPSEIYETIKIGDKLDVQYTHTGEKFVIYSAHFGDKKMRSVDAYNNYIKMNQCVGAIVFILIEVVMILVLVSLVLFGFGGSKKIFKKTKRRH